MHPQLNINWIAVIAAMVYGFIFGFLWYGPIFGKKWASYMGMDISQKPDAKVMRKALVLQVIGLFLLSYVLFFSTNIWRPTVWLTGDDSPAYVYGFFSAFFTWIGFYIPMQLGKVAWEKRPWGLFFINASHDFLNLLGIAMILSYLK